MPPIRQPAADLRIVPGTIARAYRSLETAGLVEASRSGGTKVRSGNAVSSACQRTRRTRGSLSHNGGIVAKRGQLLQAEPKAT
ncbi:hypothetical protein [Pseudarthrobacter sp. MM222]|uniref:hypothetical protein n=1 Tax=Pseudarthrobacter sp. MM222 TaxID=3018929 RepID=UPI003FA68A64